MTGDTVRPIGREVKRHRRSRGWTQEDLVRSIQDRAGPFSRRTLQNIEAGRPVHLRSIRLVAEALGVDVTCFLHDHRPTPGNLPAPLTSFVGREKELVEVRSLLGANRLLTLTGAGGCGKSRLALQVARALIPDFPDGVWLVELAPLTVPTLVPQAVATALGVREQRDRELTEVLLGDLGRRQALLLLDNCEHLLSGCADLVAALLPACPRLRVLTTSREPLNVAGETSYMVPPLQLPDANRHPCVDTLHDVESVRLFVERAAAVRSDFSLTESSAPAVIEVCRHLDGIPLALELAAARARTMSVKEIADRLADRFPLLAGGHRETVPRHRTLRALIDWSHDLLSASERVLFRRLSVFAGGWTLPAVERVCGGDSIDQSEVLDLLSHLVAKSLVEVTSDEGRGTGGSRYRLLETVRHYARERLEDEEGEAAVRRRHRDYFLALAEEAVSDLEGPDQLSWLSRLKDEHDNLRVALNTCKAGDTTDRETGLRLAGALGLFWEVYGYLSEGRATCVELLAASDASARTSIRAKALRVAGWLAVLLGETADARSCFDESLAIARELAHGDEIASALNELGVLASRQGDFAASRRCYEESLTIRRSLGDDRGTANSLMNLGVLARRQGDYAAARSLLEESLAINRKLGDKRGIAMVLVNLGNVAHVQCDSTEAYSLYAESLSMFKEVGDRYGVANTLNNLGNVAWRQQDHAAARSYYEEGLAIARDLGDRRGSARTLQNLGNVVFEEQDYAGARALYQESLDICRDLGDRQGVAESLCNLGVVARHLQRFGEARALSEESLGICRELGDKQGIAEALGNLVLVAWREADYAQAASLCVKSLALLRELGDTGGIAERLVGLGCVASHERRASRAIRLLASGQTLAKRIDCRIDPSTQQLCESSMAALRASVDDETFAREWSAGEAMDLEQAIEYALEE